MKKIDFEVAGKRYEYNAPESWEELNADQFRAYVEVGAVNVDLVRRIVGMDDVVAVSLTLSDWWWLTKEFDWMNDIENIGKLFMEELTMPDGTVYYGYNADFSDVTWEEWTFADSYASLGRWDIMTAVLYRQERPDWNRETDRRIPFTKYGTEARMEQTSKLDELTIRCVALNYKMLRKRLTDHYGHIFYEPIEEEETSKTGKKPQTKPRTDWLKLIRNMMGDNFYEEQKYLNLSVPSVLFQLESRVKEAQHGK